VVLTVASLAAGLWVALPKAQDTSAIQRDGTPAEARAAMTTDLGLVARARGWTIAEAAAHRALSDSFGQIQERLATSRPGLYAGAELPPLPDQAPTLYIKGRADALVWELVRSAGYPIHVIEGRPFSWRELEARSLRLNRRLAGLGFRDIVTSFDETTSHVEAAVRRLPAMASLRAQQVLARLPAEFQSGVRLALLDEDVVVDEHAYGGMWVRDDGVNMCTSGWSVTNGLITGVTTAGHCNGINQIVEPGVGVHALVHQAEHRGQWGDVEWKTSTHLEPDDFYASANDIRDVSSVEPRANITVGEAVCVYGRSSNARDCSHTVLRTSISCTNSGVFNDRLVAMNAKNTTIGGDSGGGWSFGLKAYGSHKGGCTVNGAVRNVFSVADLYDEALGVTVRTN
jgi:hypothetical protein